MLNISKDEKRYTEIELDLHKKIAYEKGRASIVEELEKIKAEIQSIIALTDSRGEDSKLAYQCQIVINERISELKGENK